MLAGLYATKSASGVVGEDTSSRHVPRAHWASRAHVAEGYVARVRCSSDGSNGRRISSYYALLGALVAEHTPHGSTEKHLVEELCGIVWRKLREWRKHRSSGKSCVVK